MFVLLFFVLALSRAMDGSWLDEGPLHDD
ncbi:hypothetical protein PSEUDO8Z_140002 [Pseudomonas sp. 8Z]|nr:hypothetical protein PSEUDO8Z_140002 [Pseudomonas sp. 8Z]